MKRPDIDKILQPLKPFQRRTVDHAFRRLFIEPDGTSRFLVADEVGLGKTLVARGVIARTIAHLWKDVKRIDIVYICSNASIARANLPKLRVSSVNEHSSTQATRLTELARQDNQRSFLESKLNFVSFTPSTSFELGNSGGRRSEREILFHLLARYFPPPQTGLMNLLQGGVRDRQNWRKGLYPGPKIEPKIPKRFEMKINSDRVLKKEVKDAINVWFYRHRDKWPDEACKRRNCIIGRLRRVLAGVCVDVLGPDLVILDEFQRFKALLENGDDPRTEAAELAQSLFNTKAHDGRPVRTLLMSATPYKYYTTDSEIEEEDHYKDFLDTTRFLLGNREKPIQDLKVNLSRFGKELKRIAGGNGIVDTAIEAKSCIEETLRLVMARTERTLATEKRDAMLEEKKSPVSIKSADVKQYLAADALFEAVDDHDPMPLWKSAPYLVHFMSGYKFNARLDDALRCEPTSIADVLRRHRSAFLSKKALERWSALDPANAKLRMIVSDHFARRRELWRLLWLPPTLPYWPLEGPFASNTGATKTLMFSAWNVVPHVVSAFLSYEAERGMRKKRRNKAYSDPVKQRLLQFTGSSSGRRSRHRLLLLLVPCLALADKAHPLDAPAGKNRRRWVRKRVRTLLSDLRPSKPRRGKVDERWEWAAPLLLDPGLRPFLQEWREDRLHGFSENSPFPKPNDKVFNGYLDDMLALDVASLGRQPDDLPELLTEVALGSPSIIALRTLRSASGRSASGVTDNTRRRLAVLIADAFWSLFNQPAVTSLIRQLPVLGTARRGGRIYWRQVLSYCRQGNLQAVLDEHWHLLWGEQSWEQSSGAEANAMACAEKMVQVVYPLRSWINANFLDTKKDGKIDSDKLRIRTVFALRFGQMQAESDESKKSSKSKKISPDAVLDTFNSPFRPFVLTSTSIGQEGLDFHRWCHRLVHWNLPGNPVDLEQREGRIHRYKGHAVRRNVAAAHGDSALASWKLGDDLWALIFSDAEQAARDADEPDLVPHWIAHGDTRVERHVPMLPYTREIEAFKHLKLQLAKYRVVFGQPRQEELLNLLDQSTMSTQDIQKLTIDLAPPAS